MKTMQAAYLSGHGGNEVVQIGQREIPNVGQGEVLVRIHAATLNQVDLYMRNSGAGITHELPLIMGVDGAGEVIEHDGQNQSLSVGQKVTLHPGISCGHCTECLRGETILCSSIRFLGENRDGTFAQYVRVPSAHVFPMPEKLNYTQAAALGVNHLTAWRMLFTKAQVKPWDTVLIFGIGGGVSLAALQFVKGIGARAIVTSRSEEKLQRAQEMGADVTINSSNEDIVKQVMKATNGKGVEVVIENVGEAVWPMALRSLVKGGRLALCGATTGGAPSAELYRLFVRQLQIYGSSLGTLEEFRQMLEFIENTGLRPVIDKSYDLQDIHQALSYLESGQQFGKVSLSINH